MRNAVPCSRPSLLKKLAHCARMAAASTAASVADVGVLLTLVHVGRIAAGAAGIVGCLVGGAVNFALNRQWVFSQRGPGWLRQAVLYALLVVLCGALLSGGIIQVAAGLGGVPLMVAKLLAAALVLVGWNYPVASRLVFTNKEKANGVPAAVSDHPRIQ